MQEKKAFTLIEIIVVITILAILAMIAVFSYGAARQRAKMDLIADSLVSVLKQQQELSRSGKQIVIGEESETSCYGLSFNTSVTEEDTYYVKYIRAPYVTVGVYGADYCDMDELEGEPFKDMDNFVISEIKKDGVESQDSLPIMFRPPQAKVMYSMDNLPTALRSPESSTVLITVSTPDLEQSRSFEFDPATGLIKRVKPNEET